MKMLRSGITAWQSPDTFDLDQDSVPYNASPTALSKPNLYCSLCALSKYYIPKPQSNMYMLAHAVSLEETAQTLKLLMANMVHLGGFLAIMRSVFDA